MLKNKCFVSCDNNYFFTPKYCNISLTTNHYLRRLLLCYKYITCISEKSGALTND